MLDVSVKDDVIHFGPNASVHFQRTLRIPDDGATYPLPPGLGRFPVRRIADYLDTVPEAWRTHGGVFIPMYQREAMWLRFGGARWRPNALKIAVGKVNAISGESYDDALHAPTDDTPDYVVVPNQPWLDGINAGAGFIRQFVAMPLGSGYTVEGQVTGAEQFGGIQLCCFDPVPGMFPDEAPPRDISYDGLAGVQTARAGSAEMGLAAGGKMKQKIYPDTYGIDTWDQNSSGRIYVHIVNSELWSEITGEPMPETPVTAESYTRAKLPWFHLYEGDKADVTAPSTLAAVKSIETLDTEVADASW